MTYRRLTTLTTTLVAATAMVALAPAALASPARPAAHAELQPSQLAAGTPAQLTITVDDAAQPPDVHVAGANVRYSGEASQTTIVNGTPSQATTFMYTVVPAHAGALDVPAIAIATSHGNAQTPPLHATVGAPGSAPASAAPALPNLAAGGAWGMPLPAPVTQPTGHGDGTKAFVRLELPARQLVVGQATPVKIRAYFRAGVSATLDGEPRVDSDAFTLTQLSDKPAQTQVELHGERYLVATWTGVLSPAKPSSGALGVTLPVELAYRVERPHPKHTLRDLFGDDPFADDAFASSLFDQQDPFDMFDEGEVQQVHADLHGTAGKVSVGELPAAGRPAGFTGAVGTFAIAVDPPPGDARVGEPITLTARVTGTGNFDRVALAGVPRSSELDTYDLKSTWAPGASALTGTKTFTQTLVPRRAGAQTIPPLELAYFDPVKHAYVTMQSEPIMLQVAPGAAGDTGLAATVGNPAMRPNKLAPGPVHAMLQPLARTASFWALPGALLLATLLLAGAGVWRRSQRRASRGRQQEVGRAVAVARRRMKQAVDHDDAPAFFDAARSAVQLRLAAAWGIAPEAVTPADVRARLGEAPELLALLEHADRITYTRAAAHEPLDRWLALADRELAHLEAA